jgi:hypothetical protein
MAKETGVPAGAESATSVETESVLTPKSTTGELLFAILKELKKANDSKENKELVRHFH